MAAPQTQRKPTFLWQGVLILLPVAVLATVSLVALRQDERAAEQDARNRAAENVQSLARAMRSPPPRPPDHIPIHNCFRFSTG